MRERKWKRLNNKKKDKQKRNKEIRREIQRIDLVYGMSTFVGYLTLNPVHTHTHTIYIYIYIYMIYS